MSSDSEDDCYGNIAQKLQSIKSKYKEDKIKTTNLLDDSSQQNPTSKTVDKVIKLDDSISKDCEVLKDDSFVEEISLDTIIANNTKKKATRSSKRQADISADNILPTRRRKKSKASNKDNDTVVDSPSHPDSSNLVNTPTPPSVNTKRGARKQRGRKQGSSSTSLGSSNITLDSTNTNSTSNAVSNLGTSSISTETALDSTANRLRGRRGRRGRTSTPRRNRSRRMCQLDFPMLGWFNPSPQRRIPPPESYPTYNIGNFANYPDRCHDQPLFVNPAPKTDNVVVIGENEPENDSLDENEELSVKVYWQSREHVKFTIRRFQKLTQIFDFFAKRENVSHDKLFFMYNDKILKLDDTPDSITYSIAKFIDGGIINQSITKIVQNDHCIAKGGIKLKFQCQNLKKPFETRINLHEKMAVAMMMCAEHLERPLEKLKFYFDGDLVSGKSTPRELELEGGECIDVKIIS